jgi:acetoin utilization protein AcuB
MIRVLAESLISHDVVPVKTSDTGHEVLNMMAHYHLSHLPIVNDTQLLGLISEDDILENDMDEAIGSYGLSIAKAYCFEDEHLFEIMRRMHEYKLTIMPVINRHEEYQGCIALQDFLHFFADSYSIREPGSILVVETTRLNYSLAELARIAESEGAIILGAFVSSDYENNLLYVTLKFNKTDMARIIASFERFNYTVVGNFSKDSHDEGLRLRYEQLMSYLNV